MRVEFVDSVKAVLAADSKSIFMTGDVGFNALEGIRELLGPRFINAGVAEQNMIGVSAGLALQGYRPWVYSIAPFVTYRCLEQIRNDICHHKFNVKIVGNGGGFTYGVLGSTHHTLEDISVLKAIPWLKIYFPCAGDQVATVVKKMGVESLPGYLRLGVSPFSTPMPFVSENPVTLSRIYHVGTGPTLVVGVGQATQIALRGLKEGSFGSGNPSIVGLGMLSDPDELRSDKPFMELVAKAKQILVVEEHYERGGVGESLRSMLTQFKGEFKVLAPRVHDDKRYGSARFHAEQNGLTPEGLSRLVNS